jgi:pilus assembly protein Flp/PilA
VTVSGQNYISGNQLVQGLRANGIVVSILRGICPMLKYYIKTTEALKQLRADKDGVVSFEYVVVAFCIVTTVLAVFGTGGNSAISNALNGAITKITGLLPA